MCETRDLAKRSGRFFCLFFVVWFFFLPLDTAMGSYDSQRDSASTLVLELCGSGVTELLTAASAEGCI